MTYIERVISRGLGHWLDGVVGTEQFRTCVEKQILITDLLSEDYRQILKAKAMRYAFFLNKLDNNDFYAMIPAQYQEILASFPHGRSYGLRQLQVIRDYLTA